MIALVLILGAMLGAAVAAVLWPLYRRGAISSWRAMAAVLLVAAAALPTYYFVGAPDARDVVAVPMDESPAAVEAMVASLAERLQTEPDDVDGWKMLGRSYAVMGRFDDAVNAYERAAALENSGNGETLAELAEALFLANNEALDGRAGELFESALALAPGNPKALFYSGMAAARRGDNLLAADRWEALLATSPPPEVEQALRTRIAAFRGEAPPPVPAPVEASDTALAIDIEMADAVAALDPGSTVFVIARDPAQPSPPIAVARRKLGELPGRVTLTDADAMVPGRPLGGTPQIEIVVRVSTSGQPMAQPGDWFGSETIQTDGELSVTVTVDRQVE